MNQGAESESAAPASGSGALIASFGTLLRFWRHTFGLSQERLAAEADISARHVSFLENDRARSGKEVALRLAAALALGPQERARFLMAAGHAPGPGHGRSPPVDAALIALMLRHADPVPAMVMGRDGHIAGVNKAWLHVHRRYLGDLAEKTSLNAIRLFVDPRGWRRFVENWVDIASVYFVMLQQYALLERSAAAGHLLRELLAVPGVPDDWARRGAALSGSRADYGLLIGPHGGPRRAVRIVHNMVGTFPLGGVSDLVIQYAIPEDGVPLLNDGDRRVLRALTHPLCPYD